MHIILTGDSWINGAYDMPDLVEPTHPGLQWFLQHETNHHVTNLAIRGSGNQEANIVLSEFLKINDKPVDLILFSQCSFMRDYFKFRHSFQQNQINWQKLHKQDLDWNAKTYDDIIAPNFRNVYTTLKNISNGIPVFVIGGNTKFHACADDYFPNSKVSFSRLSIDLVESYFDRNQELISFNYYADKYKSLTREQMTIEMENYIQMIDSWEKSGKYFLHKHATLIMHKNLFFYLKDQLNL